MWLFGYGRGLQMSKVTDGTSSTALISEVRLFDNDVDDRYSDDIRGVWVSASMGASTYSHFTLPNSTTPDAINDCGSNRKQQDLVCQSIPVTGERAGDTYAAARSEHPGGVVVAKVDGSVRFYSNNVAPDVWLQFASRSGALEE